MPRGKRSMYNIVLKGLEPSEVLAKYYNIGVKEESIELTPVDPGFNDCDNIQDIQHNEKEGYIYFKDPMKGEVKNWIHMYNIHSEPLPNFTNKPCWHCRNTFDTKPLACPIKYVTADGKTISVLNKNRNWNLPLDEKGYFIGEGIMCSPQCIKGYIYDELAKTKKSKYKESLSLLTLLLIKICGRIINDLRVAPSWKLTIRWGGHLTPVEYRMANGKLSYIEICNTKLPLILMSSFLHQERIINN